MSLELSEVHPSKFPINGVTINDPIYSDRKYTILTYRNTGIVIGPFAGAVMVELKNA